MYKIFLYFKFTLTQLLLKKSKLKFSTSPILIYLFVT